MTKALLTILILLATVICAFGQHPEAPSKELLKKYSRYTHKFEPKSCWKYKYELENGLVVRQENYCKNKLTYRAEFEYDNFENVTQETETFNINDGVVNNVSEIELVYKDGNLIRKVFDFGLTEMYSDFTPLGKPRLIERVEGSDFKMWPYKELITYDEKGNIIKSIELSKYEDANGKTVNEKATTTYKYDALNNVIALHRKFEPEREFPIIMIGGPAKYEFEYFRYRYHKNGLWSKKFKTTEGKEYLVAKIRYKLRR